MTWREEKSPTLSRRLRKTFFLCARRLISRVSERSERSHVRGFLPRAVPQMGGANFNMLQPVSTYTGHTGTITAISLLPVRSNG